MSCESPSQSDSGNEEERLPRPKQQQDQEQRIRENEHLRTILQELGEDETLFKSRGHGTESKDQMISEKDLASEAWAGLGGKV